MTWRWPTPQSLRLSIFGRTFLLSFTVLLVAEGIGLALVTVAPSSGAPPLGLADIASSLQSGRAGGTNMGPPSLPNANLPAGGAGGPPGGANGLPPGPPPDLPPGALDANLWAWRLIQSAHAPDIPPGTDDSASARLTSLLASRLGASDAEVRVYVKKTPWIRPGGMSADSDLQRLQRGFVAAWERPDGSWRVLQGGLNSGESLQDRALWLFSAGLLAMLPVSWAFARALSAPIRRFAEAAKQLGTDPNASPLERGGPAEMRSAIDAFNAMQARVTRLLKERSEMVGAIAHDLRTPLMRLAFRLDGLSSPLKEKVEADLQEMRLMISATLDFVRDRSIGGMREPLDFRLLVESVVDDQADIGHDVTLAAGNPITLKGDPIALRRAVANIVDNAMKYGERARLRVREADSQCILDVDDDGAGIPEALQERVFEPFFRAETSRNRDTGGIGLGLTTVRSILADHSGSISVRNRKEGGLRVSIALPLPNKAH